MAHDGAGPARQQRDGDALEEQRQQGTVETKQWLGTGLGAGFGGNAGEAEAMALAGLGEASGAARDSAMGTA